MNAEKDGKYRSSDDAIVVTRFLDGAPTAPMLPWGESSRDGHVMSHTLSCLDRGMRTGAYNYGPRTRGGNRGTGPLRHGWRSRGRRGRGHRRRPARESRLRISLVPRRGHLATFRPLRGPVSARRVRRPPRGPGLPPSLVSSGDGDGSHRG